ncbi:MAG TPA: hypothetical protein VGO40_00355 [Longimicrobium sp.]|jgi:hypothetical protein|nr:hypothetical protein [Longimicrobium sp.]
MASRALVLPAIGVAVLPKCPACVMVVLGALGVGHGLHGTVFALLRGVVLVAVVSLLVIRRRRAPAQILFAVAAACGALMGVTDSHRRSPGMPEGSCWRGSGW